MIDTDKMRGLLARINDCTKPVDAADRSGVLQYIDALLAEVEAGKQQIDALLATVAECREKAFVEGYADSLLGAAVGSPDEVPAFVGQTVAELRAELEAAAAHKQDADRWRAVRDTLSGAVGAGIEVNEERLSYEDPVTGKEVCIFWYPDTPVGFCDVHGSTLDEAADELIAQRQEKS